MIGRLLLLTLIVGAVLAPSGAQTGGEPILRGGVPVSFDAMIADLATADVVCIGEQHGNAAGHAMELRILRALGSVSPRLGLSLEMFERDVQIVVDEYLAGHITESAFLGASRPWPGYKTDYRPLVEWCRDNRRPVIAANVPRRYVNIVSRNGQNALTKLPRASRAWLPRIPYPMDLSPEYDRALTDLFTAPHGAASMPSMPSPEQMKEAQALWDYGMADSILRARTRSKLQPVVHVCGSMHCERGFGIVERLRGASRRLRIITVILRPQTVPVPAADELPAAALGDYVIATAANVRTSAAP